MPSWVVFGFRCWVVNLRSTVVLGGVIRGFDNFWCWVGLQRDGFVTCFCWFQGWVLILGFVGYWFAATRVMLIDSG